MLPFHRYGQTHMAERFQRLIKILDGCSELTLLNSPSSTGAYAFVHCSTEESCADYLAKVNLYGNEGTKYGMTVNGQCLFIANTFYIIRTCTRLGGSKVGGEGEYLPTYSG